jgi:hypothetical protein
MIRCSAGHFYDPAKHTGCPWCGPPLDADPRGAAEAGDGKTVPVRPQGAQPARGAAPQGATLRLIETPQGIDPVVGWLVCIHGPDRGRDYRLHLEKNFIGRAPAMDVCIAGDGAISREKHATVTFEPKKRQFWLIPGESSGLVYLNGEVLHVPTQIREGDVIEMGKTRLVLIPFVSDSFRWDGPPEAAG